MICRTLVDFYVRCFMSRPKNIKSHSFCLTLTCPVCFFLFKQNSSHKFQLSAYFLHQSVNQGGDQELENLVTKLAILKDLLSSIEKKVQAYIQSRVGSCSHIHTHTHTHTDSCWSEVVSLDNPPHMMDHLFRGHSGCMHSPAWGVQAGVFVCVCLTKWER